MYVHVISMKSSATTTIGFKSATTATGFALPPFFVFEGKRMVNDLMTKTNQKHNDKQKKLKHSTRIDSDLVSPSKPGPSY